MIEEYFSFVLNQLDVVGFLKTRAPLSVDIIVTFLAMLPLLSALSIFLAMRKYLKLHQRTQMFLFFLSLAFLAAFAYIVHYQEGFDLLLQESHFDSTKALFLLVVHVVISLVTLVLWGLTLFYALSDSRRRGLPGVYSVSHAKAGKRVFTGIVFTASSSVCIYWVLFLA